VRGVHIIVNDQVATIVRHIVYEGLRQHIEGFLNSAPIASAARVVKKLLRGVYVEVFEQSV